MILAKVVICDLRNRRLGTVLGTQAAFKDSGEINLRRVKSGGIMRVECEESQNKTDERGFPLDVSGETFLLSVLLS